MASSMQDEYGAMDDSGLTYIHQGAFQLESGEHLTNPQVRYNTWGKLNATRDNVLFICHALTGNSRLDTWWGGLLGPGKAFDTNKYLVVGANIIGSCYGSTGPCSLNPETKKRYGSDFPTITIRDTVALHMEMVKVGLRARAVHCVIGGSFGGMQALEWAIMGGPEFVRLCCPIACGAAHTAWQIGISETQRQAIYADLKWRGGAFPPEDPPTAGLSVARQIAMFSYRTGVAFEGKFGRRTADGSSALSTHPDWEVKRYLEYQGQKFLNRFDALTYVKLTEQMDTHDIARGRGDAKQVLSKVPQPCLILSIDSDILYPPHEQRFLATHLPRAHFVSIRSDDGHDGFLLAQDQVSAAITQFLDNYPVPSSSKI
eukprot:c7719_g1_i1.p1 GENE.c7719_g1_i1~~c7719_g1_i1.p1  ORF type:complete len:372 (-),score=67.17 c7719_g1_i1:1205-2320(-)